MPSAPLKPDAAQIQAFLNELKGSSWLRGNERSWWPDYVFHFTSIENAVDILEQGELKCRNDLESRHHVFTDYASQDVIGRTSSNIKNCVRLYFRPRTPTQYHLEGIRPAKDYYRDTGGHTAHLPVPVFFLFKSSQILTRLDCEFTNGNAARAQAQRGSTAAFLRTLPFHKIYHNRWFSPAENEDITFHRNAEILIPKRLDLSALAMIVCRSPAEKDTLLSMLSKKIRSDYLGRIRVGESMQLFERRWTFVEEVLMGPKSVIIRFSPDTQGPGPFQADFILKNMTTGKQSEHRIPDFDVSTNGHSIEIKFTLQPPSSDYEFTLMLDNRVAYTNRYLQRDLGDIPF